MSLDHDRNEYQEFQDRFGDYTFYSTKRDEILREFNSAYNSEEELEKLLMVENPREVEDDLFHFFTTQDETEGLLSGLRTLLERRSGKDEYAEFVQDLEVEPTDEDMLYWFRYEP